MLAIDETNIKALKTRLNELKVTYTEEEFCFGTAWDTGSRFYLNQPVIVDGQKVDYIKIHQGMAFSYKNKFLFNAGQYYAGDFDMLRVNLPAKTLNTKGLMDLTDEEVNQLFNDLIRTRGPDLECSQCGEKLGDEPGFNFAKLEIEVLDISGGHEVCPHLICKDCSK